MHKIPYTDFHYQTEKRAGSVPFPSLVFYLRLFCIVFRASRLAKKNCYDGSDWMESSYEVMQRLEKVGIRIEISGIENLVGVRGPAVIIGNHMSMMETLLLPAMVQPVKPVTFVVKEKLLSYPVFKHIMLSRNPIAVTRTNPRQDLKTVLNEGLDRLKKDISIIVFPQTTRSHTFDARQMSSIGVKLAKKAGVPIVPLALKTDCWQNGKRIKDFGKLDVTKTAHFAFGEPITVEGKGDAEHVAVNAFIAGKLKEWEDQMLT
jgi:1-acyl-sn-glycerol-3-phosphate acyltransferase